MNQGKLEMVKQKMARVHTDILEISQLKGTGMDEFNSGEHYIYYYGQESLRRNEIALRVNPPPPPPARKKSEMQILGAVSKRTE